MGPLGTNFSEILIEIYIFLLKKIHLKISARIGGLDILPRSQCVLAATPKGVMWCCSTMACEALWLKIIDDAKKTSVQHTNRVKNEPV